METIIRVPLEQLHLEHELWKNEFSFYSDELRVLNKFLEQVAGRNTALDALKGIEHFQNQFIRQKEVLDELLHEIHSNEKELLGLMKRMKDSQIDKARFSDHVAIRERVETYRKLYAEMKEEFMRFVARWL